MEWVAWYLVAGMALGIVFDWLRGEPPRYSMGTVLRALALWPVIAALLFYDEVWRHHSRACWRVTQAAAAAFAVLRVFHII